MGGNHAGFRAIRSVRCQLCALWTGKRYSAIVRVARCADFLRPRALQAAARRVLPQFGKWPLYRRQSRAQCSLHAWARIGCRFRSSGSRLAPPTLAIANDETFGDLLTPTKQGGQTQIRYDNSASAAGVAGDRDGNIHGGMGADWGDYDNDGQFDLFVATFRHEAKSLYHNDGGGAFSDATYLTGIAPMAMGDVAFGCKLFDFDNDGLLDLMIANGHVQDNIQAIEATATYLQKPLLLHNRGGKSVTFENVSGGAGAAFAKAIVGRGLAIGDYDNDGRIDAMIVDSEGSLLLLHNETPSVGHWLGVTLTGTRSNRDGTGAIVTASSNGHVLTRLCHTDGSYMSASDRRVHFGLGAAQAVDALTVHWPDGHTDTLTNITGGRYITVKEGEKP